MELNFTTTNNNNNINVYIDIERVGYGAILATMDTTETNKDLNDFLNTMNIMTQKPLSSYSVKWNYLPQQMAPINTTKLYTSPPDKNMIEIPWGIFYFVNYGNDGSGGNNTNAIDIQYSFEIMPRYDHKQYITMNKFYIDKYPVTCSEYKQYLTDSNYKPNDRYNYLKNWIYDNITDTYTIPMGYENKPVTYLGLNEARLYCSFIGKRLPHSYEWQYAAQGNTSYLYPWGNKQQMGTRFPQTQHERY